MGPRQSLFFLFLLLAPIVLAGCTGGNPPGDGNGGSDEGVTYVRPASPIVGRPDAPVTLVAFESPKCTGCRHFHLGDGSGPSAYQQLRATYLANGSVRVVDRSFYLGYPVEEPLANGQKCAWHLGGAGAYLNLSTAIYEDLPALTPQSAGGFLERFADRENLTARGFMACVNARTHDAEIAQDRADAQALAVTGTPAFFVLDRHGKVVERINGPAPFATFARALDAALQRA